MKKIKVLCLCAKGLNRSKYLSEYLRKMGYSTRYRGIEEDAFRKVNNKIVEWADVIIIVRKRLVDLFNKKFPKLKKKLITLDVSDSKRLLPDKYSYLKDLDYFTFQKKWTRPRLREAIKKYLPLRKK